VSAVVKGSKMDPLGVVVGMIAMMALIVLGSSGVVAAIIWDICRGIKEAFSCLFCGHTRTKMEGK